jgi:peptidoglycan/xylan/chitin deacetylase (PgdA/CDA1 family)
MALVFDDGQREQAVIAGPLLDALGLKATFVVNPGKVATTSEGWFASWDELRALAKAGHEIGNHSMTHPNFTKTADAALQEEIVGAQQRIAKEIGQPCVTFCYPFNAETPASRELVRKTHAVWTGGERKTYGGPTFAAETANAWADQAIAGRTLVVAMIHGIETGYLPFTGRAVLRAHLEYLKSKQEQLWVAPIGVIGRYQQELAACRLAAEAGAGKATFTLACPLDPATYDIPLTVVIDCGSAPASASAKRDGGKGAIPVTVVGKSIHCEVAPGKGAVTVSWK